MTRKLEIEKDFITKKNSYFHKNYVEKNKTNYLRRLRNSLICEEIDKLSQYQKVLDVGCGPAVLYPNLLEKCDDYYALDLVRSNLDQLVSNYSSKKIHPILCDFDNFQWEEDFFDLVICSGSIEYTSDPETVIRSLVRSTKPGGLIICSFPNFRSPYRIWSEYVYRHIWVLKNRLLRRTFSNYRRKLFRESTVWNLFGIEAKKSNFSINYFGLKLIPQPFDQLFADLDNKLLRVFEEKQYRISKRFSQEFILTYQKPFWKRRCSYVDEEKPQYMTRVLWITPNLNHYKSRFLNRLAAEDLELTVLSGRELLEQGHRQATDDVNFEIFTVPVGKSSFQYHLVVYRRLTSLVRKLEPATVMMPIEKKFSMLIFYLALLRLRFQFRLVSYNHPLLKSSNATVSESNKLVTKMFYWLYDRIIFYTENARDWAVENNLLPTEKAFFANNTLDTKSIWDNYEFTINSNASKSILFIGRLIPSKRLELLLEYFLEIQKKLPDCKLKIIGDGPERHLVEKAVAENSRIYWLGAIVEESEISRHMSEAHIVFVPGASGLSIVHAFCYGKPYVTLRHGNVHGPELTYLEDGTNGLLLGEIKEENISKTVSLLSDQSEYSKMCQNAYDTAQKLSIENWCQQIKLAMQ